MKRYANVYQLPNKTIFGHAVYASPEDARGHRTEGLKCIGVVNRKVAA